ncbi:MULTISPECIES: Rho-binding antiterminator [unclassified Nitrosomonas]|jgi:Rho-binding antiterminator|uniref:Rho-binding antiterminator n=1 Tax=unclassified Nitrosomonas TaxID=2609265 RepID=UPI001D225E5E|nr:MULTISPECIES: Rho-binding antiterminator [unclassified Nitrosomonas]MBX9894781.1 Rho-binding antiterminator [Nitrosomonas sp.]WMJ07403.1 Rho-binding antiterminator [Nitrosomonas sp. sh817]
MSNTVIDCELHDFVEVACMYRYQLKLILKDGQVIEGKAVDIASTPDKRECLIVENDTQQQVDLMSLAKMEVLTPNAKFSEVVFD